MCADMCVCVCVCICACVHLCVCVHASMCAFVHPCVCVVCVHICAACVESVRVTGGEVCVVLNRKLPCVSYQNTCQVCQSVSQGDEN